MKYQFFVEYEIFHLKSSFFHINMLINWKRLFSKHYSNIEKYVFNNVLIVSRNFPYIFIFIRSKHSTLLENSSRWMLPSVRGFRNECIELRGSANCWWSAERIIISFLGLGFYQLPFFIIYRCFTCFHSFGTWNFSSVTKATFSKIGISNLSIRKSLL